jgi:hypothetical protein
MSELTILGIDPDTKTTGVGIVRGGRPVYGTLIEVPDRRAKIDKRRLTMADRVALWFANARLLLEEARSVDIVIVEGQRIYTPKPGEKGPRPADILHLGQVAGMALGCARMAYPVAELQCPLPAKWKGTMKKAAFTKKALKELGLEVTDRGLVFAGSKARVPGTVGLDPKDATHTIDALALAHWAYMRQPR